MTAPPPFTPLDDKRSSGIEACLWIALVICMAAIIGGVMAWLA